MENSIAARIKLAREAKRLSQTKLAELIQASRSAVQSYERGSTRPNIGVTQALARALECDFYWLLGGEQNQREIAESFEPLMKMVDIIQKSKITIGEPAGALPEGEYVSVPLVRAQPAAGGGTHLESYDDKNIDYLAFRREWLAGFGRLPNLKLMEVKGDSMEPIISDSDVVLLDFSRTELRPGKIFAVAFDGHVYLKRLYAEPGRLILRSDNKVHTDIVIDLTAPPQADMVKVIAQAVWWCHAEKVDSSRLAAL
jgi:phage repressor protein C with HTH and peptisase S24 domain